MGAVKALVLCVGFLLAWPAMSQQQAHPSGQASVAAGAREQLNIVSTTQDADVADLLADFRARHPEIDTVHTKINSNDIYNQIVDPSTSSAAPGDIIWSSAMICRSSSSTTGMLNPMCRRKLRIFRTGQSGRTKPMR